MPSVNRRPWFTQIYGDAIVEQQNSSCTGCSKVWRSKSRLSTFPHFDAGSNRDIDCIPTLGHVFLISYFVVYGTADHYLGESNIFFFFKCPRKLASWITSFFSSLGMNCISPEHKWPFFRPPEHYIGKPFPVNQAIKNMCPSVGIDSRIFLRKYWKDDF
jgi:hypothetical protein